MTGNGVLRIVLLSAFALGLCCANGSTLTTSYDPQVGDAFAALAQAAYCSDAKSLPHLKDWSCGPCKRAGIDIVPGSLRTIEGQEVLTQGATFLFVARIKETSSVFQNVPFDGCVVSFRGSHDWANWIKDFEAWHEKTPFKWCTGCEVESGFFSVWEDIQAAVIGNLTEIGCAPSSAAGATNNLWITGHSLGAAVSTAAMFILEKSGYNVQLAFNFESPRVGNKNFAEAFDDEFQRSIPMFRITHAHDPVVHLPMEDLGYQHVKSEVFYNASGSWSVCEDSEYPKCSDRYGLWTIFYAGDHCASPQVPNKNICDCDLINHNPVNEQIAV